MARTITDGKCEGCGTPFPPYSSRGRRRKWCSGRCRKQTLYSGQCIDCGAPTNGYDGPALASERCVACRRQWEKDNARWTPEAIADALRADAAKRGRPPTAAEWTAATAATPTTSTVQFVMGSWNAGLEAAGLDARPVGCYGRPGEDPEVVQQTVELYRSGLSMEAVARQQGVVAATVGYRLRKFGEPIRSIGDYWNERRETIAELWRAGLSGAEIAARVGAPSGSAIHQTVSDMRAAGWDVPYRHQPRARVPALEGKDS